MLSALTLAATCALATPDEGASTDHFDAHLARPRTEAPGARRFDAHLNPRLDAQLGPRLDPHLDAHRDAHRDAHAATHPMPPVAPAGPGTASYLVTFDTETRWDAWSASLTRGADSRGPRAAQAPLAASESTAIATTCAKSESTIATTCAASESTAIAAARAASEAAADRIAAWSAVVADAVVASGGAVISRYDTATAGLLVHASPDAARAIAGMPHVSSIQPAPIVSVELLDSVPGVGATRVQEELGISGEGSTIAIVDTGADYTHAALGGPGSQAAYEAAAADAERVTDAWQGSPLFPNDKVVAGHDFAGPLYDPGCTAVAERQGLCASVPAPDPDPLDTHGHGTHVSSIAAGRASGAVGVGVAPGARVVALKIFGSSGTTDLIIDPIEWAIEANLGVDGRPHVDVLNLSVGQRYGAEILLEQSVVQRAADAGIVVVASVGNDSYLPFIAAAPGIAPDALAVASYSPPGQRAWTAVLTPVSSDPVTFESDALFPMTWSPMPRVGLEAEAVFVGRGCPGNGGGDTRDPYLADPTGRLAMLELAWGNGGASCTADRQALRAQEAGAVGVLIDMGMGADAASAWTGSPIVDIPVWTVNHRLGSTIRELSPDDTPARLSIESAARPDEDGVVSEFSSRGPARTGALKPNLAAPGSGIFAAAMGQGTRGVAYSGTSMAAPHVAGGAALAWSAARTRQDSLSARDIAASLVTAADPDEVHQSAERREPPPVTRVGAGALDVYRTVTSRTGVRAGAIADLGMGIGAYTEPVTRQLALTVTNRTTGTVTYRVTPRFRVEVDQGQGLDLRVDPQEFQLSPGHMTIVPITAAVDPESLPEWGMLGGAGVGDTDALTTSELDGWLEIDPSPDDPDDPVQRVPFYLLARRASELSATWLEDESEPALRVHVSNAAAFRGGAEWFELVSLDGPDPSLPAKIDVDAVGVRASPDGQGNTIVEFLVHTRGTRVHPLETATEVELDTDLDGRVDYVVYTEDEAHLRTGVSRNGRVMTALDEPGGSPFGSPTARFHAFVDLHSRFTGLPILIEDTGLTPSTLRFGLRVRQRDFVEGDVTELVPYDQVPDDDGWLVFDGRSGGEVPGITRTDLAGGASEWITVTAPPPNSGILAIFPHNAPGAGDFSVWPELEAPFGLSLPWVSVGALVDEPSPSTARIIRRTGAMPTAPPMITKHVPPGDPP